MIPQITDIEHIFSPVVDRDNLRILKDCQGRFYVPGRFNNIPFYNVDEGYLIKLDEPDSLTVIGYDVVDWRPLHLPEGWSTVAYFPSDTVDAHTAFHFFRPYLIIAKDDEGHFYVPGSNFCNMPPLTRWNGYQVKMSRYWETGWNTEPRE